MEKLIEGESNKPKRNYLKKTSNAKQKVTHNKNTEKISIRQISRIIETMSKQIAALCVAG